MSSRSRHHPYRRSRRTSGMSARSTGRRRPQQAGVSSASTSRVQADPGGCIDLTANDTLEGDVIDLTESTPNISNRSAFDADPVVVISPIDVESADAHSNRRRLPVINWSSDEENGPDVIDVEVEVAPGGGPARVRSNAAIAVDDSDDELPSVPFPVRNAIDETPDAERTTVRCPVCFDSHATIRRSNRKLFSTTCGHIFCSTCIKQVLQAQGNCPSCRKKLTKKQIHEIFL